MFRSSLWLSLASGAPGLGGPFVQERLAPYESIAALGDAEPRVVLAIGGRLKRKCLNAACEEQAVAIRYLPEISAVLIDCELHHLQEAPRVRGGPRRGDMSDHELRNAPTSPSQIAHDMYIRLLAPFSAVVLLFIPDLGGLQGTVCLLAKWVQSSIQTPLPFWPRFVLVGVEMSEKAAFSWIITKILANLRVSDPLHAHTATEISKLARDCLHLDILAAPPPSAHAAWLGSRLDDGCARRRGLGLAFSAFHWTNLFRLALAQYARRPSEPIDFCRLARAATPLDDFPTHLMAFVRAASSKGFDHAAVVASALCLDAYPPGAHAFPPEKVFSALYEDTLLATERAANARDLTRSVRARFVDTATIRLESSNSPWESHLQLLGMFREHWKSVPSADGCWVCMVRAAARTLSCRHRLCGRCVTSLSAQAEGAKRADGTALVPLCPLCLDGNSAEMCSRPTTAGRRVLSLEGGRPEDILSFLDKLKRAIALTGLPFRRHFDTVIGTGIGVILVVAIFVKGQTIEECKHILRHAKAPWYSLKDCIRLGYGLKGKWRDVRHTNEADVIVRGRTRLYSNFLPSPDTKLQCLEGLRDDLQEHSDIFVQYSKLLDGDRLLASISRRLTAALFYVELVEMPAFYRWPQTCRLVLHCRLGPGPALLALLRDLYYQNACISFRADEPGCKEIPLCTARVLSECERVDFARHLEMEVSSSSSSINVKVGTLGGAMESVSRCPYRLSDLIRDQGLEKACTSADHKYRNTVEEHDYTVAVKSIHLDCGTKHDDVQRAKCHLQETVTTLRQLRWMTS